MTRRLSSREVSTGATRSKSAQVTYYVIKRLLVIFEKALSSPKTVNLLCSFSFLSPFSILVIPLITGPRFNPFRRANHPPVHSNSPCKSAPSPTSHQANRTFTPGYAKCRRLLPRPSWNRSSIVVCLSQSRPVFINSVRLSATICPSFSLKI